MGEKLNRVGCKSVVVPAVHLKSLCKSHIASLYWQASAFKGRK